MRRLAVGLIVACAACGSSSGTDGSGAATGAGPGGASAGSGPGGSGVAGTGGTAPGGSTGKGGAGAGTSGSPGVGGSTGGNPTIGAGGATAGTGGTGVGGAAAGTGGAGVAGTTTAGGKGGTGGAGGGCAPGKEACGAVCCDTDATCGVDDAGNKLCLLVCTTSSGCPPAKGCCTVIAGVKGKGVCLPPGSGKGQQCRCEKASECNNGCCAPVADANGNPVGPYVCKANDGSAYGCCNSGVACGGGYCCVNLTDIGSSVCEEPCNNNGNCGPGTCTQLTSGLCNTSTGSCVPQPGT